MGSKGCGLESAVLIVTVLDLILRDRKRRNPV